MPSCTILYHYYYPDDVVSARHFTDFAESLYSSAWKVRVFTSNRYCRKPGVIFPKCEIRKGVNIKRFTHPPFPQSANIGRLLNSFFLSAMWFFDLLFIHTDVVVFGTDPQFSFFLIPFLAFFRPRLRLALWGFDLYPEAIFADGMRLPNCLKILLKWWTGISYRRCGLLVDIGSCMRRRFLAYHPHARYETIIPWALKELTHIEKPDPTMRHNLFGDAKLGILYSGTIGKAHQFEEFILLARELRMRNASIAFCFAGRGNCYHELQNMVTPEDVNINFAGFIEEEFLPIRLAAADMHMISLRQGWEGIVVPSKFFGSLASGRPLLYCGTNNSCIAEIIVSEEIGFVIRENTIRDIADNLEELVYDRIKLSKMQERAFLLYSSWFSKKVQCKKWDSSLRNFI
jgi:glycosyltransferase involved in cell wall biosynthesis